MTTNKSVNIAFLILMTICIFAVFNTTKAQIGANTGIQQAVFWGDDSLKTEIFLVRKSATDYHLVINSPVQYEVYYRTEINSIEPVIQKIIPGSLSDDKFHRYNFTHEFTRTTPWLALEFKRDGKSYLSLNRTLLGEMSNSVANNGYWKPGE